MYGDQSGEFVCGSWSLKGYDSDSELHCQSYAISRWGIDQLVFLKNSQTLFMFTFPVCIFQYVVLFVAGLNCTERFQILEYWLVEEMAL